MRLDVPVDHLVTEIAAKSPFAQGKKGEVVRIVVGHWLLKQAMESKHADATKAFDDIAEHLWTMIQRLADKGMIGDALIVPHVEGSARATRRRPDRKT